MRQSPTQQAHMPADTGQEYASDAYGQLTGVRSDAFTYAARICRWSGKL